MYMGKHVDASAKQQALVDIKNGLAVKEVAAKYQVTETSIYTWLRQQADNTGTSALELAKLRKENTELKELIGLLTLEKKRAEKNTGRP